MEHVERDVFQSKISRFVDLLVQESQGALVDLENALLAEEDRGASRSERLEIAETAFAKCAQRIREQRACIANLGGDDPKLAAAKRVLSNLRDILIVIQSERDRLKYTLG